MMDILKREKNLRVHVIVTKIESNLVENGE